MISALKRRSLNMLEMLGEYIFFLLDVTHAAIRRPCSWNLIREQLYHLGVMSFSVVAITGFTTGFVLAAQSFYQLGEKGLAGVTGVLVAKSMITELGPILTALMVTGRVGASMCAELGTMKVTEQIDALKSMAIDPNAYLVAPRFIAGFVMIPLLTIFSIVMGIFGGYLIAASYFHMPSTTFLEPMKVHISSFDIATGLIKAFVFGVLLVTVCCFKGMKTTGGAAGVGRSTTQSVVTSYVLILLSDFFLTMLLNMIHMKMKHL
jgi:phospholipid/cholesterol/gamma-HCH transport system permease protein